ncbi:MAG TPA: tRNA (adenosine(37)-N6)-dimethylallyltransferase MiaA [Candidatus Saccharimonadales bacterium]|nr:tRNA (adenosine(37)-N6)-dimethylallyltransferase MiaA [Candidatus Saccharimonadales bacterium]
MQSVKPLIVIVGPTASGKSDLAMTIAETYDGEIICADSRTVYGGMDIGTAKPTDGDRSKVQHHLLDIVTPGQPFTAADFKRLANEAIADIRARGKLPLLVGGTGLYIDAVIFDYDFGAPADPERRAELLAKSIDELQQICRDSHIEIPYNMQNKRHLIRAIELGGLPKREAIMIDNTFVVGISTERDVLKERIKKRAYAMIKAGILDEVRRLGQAYGWDNEAMTGNIYRIFRGVVEGTKTEEEAIEEFIRSDMSLAKRQRTWFKRNPAIVWGAPADLEKRIVSYIRTASHFGTIGQTGNKKR